MGLRHALTFALAAALAAMPVAAQTVYKLIDRNGKVTYSEQPPKDFDGKVIRIDIDPNANRASLGTGPKTDAGQSKGKAEETKAKAKAEAASHEERLEQAKQKLDAARKALEDAQQNPGEGDIRWLGNVGGGTRPVPTEAYQQRLAKLEHAVKEAEDEVQSLEK
jgi:predicted lipid-binding transport protein (Tim44 family)